MHFSSCFLFLWCLIVNHNYLFFGQYKEDSNIFMVLFYKCCFCCLEKKHVYYKQFHINTLWIQDLRKRNVTVNIIQIMHNQLDERIAYFCDGVSKKCSSVLIEKKALNKYYYPLLLGDSDYPSVGQNTDGLLCKYSSWITLQVSYQHIYKRWVQCTVQFSFKVTSVLKEQKDHRYLLSNQLLFRNQYYFKKSDHFIQSTLYLVLKNRTWA